VILLMLNYVFKRTLTLPRIYIYIYIYITQKFLGLLSKKREKRK
jgi:hypothetical protein